MESLVSSAQLRLHFHLASLVEPPCLKLKASKQKLCRFYVGAQFGFVETYCIGNGLETKEQQIHATYSGRLPSAFNLDSGPYQNVNKQPYVV